MRVNPYVPAPGSIVLGVLACSLGLLPGSSHASSPEAPPKPQRHALVLGNTDYTTLSDLPSAKADAARLRKELVALGFEVMPVDALSSAASFYDEVLPAFRERLREGDLALVYFSGHGFSYGAGNFLAPLDLPNVLTRNELADRAVSLDAIQSALSRQKPGALVLLIDACRAVAGFVVEGDTSGLVPAAMSPLSQPVAPSLNLFAGFAARPGQLAVASSEPDKLSVFTNSLAPRLSSHAEFATMFKDVIVAVRQSSGDTQDPGLVSFAETDLYLPSDAARELDEQQAWIVASSSGDRRLVDGFRRRHALSPYAELARRWLAEHPQEVVAVADISPLALERAWNQPSPSISKPGGLTLSLPARMDLAASHQAVELPDEKPAENTAAQLARLLAYRQVVTAAEIAARVSPSPSAAEVTRVPAGTEVIVRDVQRRAENGSAWVEVQMASSGLRAYMPLSTGPATAGKPVAVGTGLLEVTALPVPGRLPDLVDEQVVRAALAQLAAQGKVVRRVSLATAAGAGVETERIDRLARSNHASYLLRQGGIPADRITAVAEAPGMDGPGVRIRFFGE